MQKIRVGVLRGGISPEYTVSLKTGESVLTHLDSNKYDARDIYIDKQGVWHLGGFAVKPEKIAQEVDVVFNALHGEYGEDGKVQQQLESFRVPYTGSRIVPSAIAMNKGLAKHCFEYYSIKTPRGVTIKRGDDLHVILLPLFREVSHTFVVKPLTGGSSLGVFVTRSFEELIKSVEMVLAESNAAIVEEYIQGRELTCGVVDGLNDKSYALYPIEIVRGDKEGIWDYDAKYSGKTMEVCPANIDEKRYKEIQQLAVRAHEAIGLRHYSRADFMVSSKGIYLLEVNSLPGLTPESLVPKALSAAELEFSDFLDYLVTLALTKK